MINETMEGGCVRIIRAFVLILLVALSVITSKGQSSNLRFKHLGIADGLSQSSAYCLFQDSKGFIWIGTTDGLSRYDGYEFRHFKYDQNDPHSLSNNELLSLGEDDRGNLLVGTTVGLDLFDPKSERFYKVLPAGSKSKRMGFVNVIFKDSRGHIWIGNQGGLFRYDGQTQTVTSVAIDTSRILQSATTIAEDSRHTLWIGYGNAIIHYDPATGKRLPLPAALITNPCYTKSRIAMIRIDSAQNIWIGTERDGLMVIHDPFKLVSGKDVSRFVNYRSDSRPAPLSNDMIRAICFQKGNAWIGNRSGLYIITPDERIARHIVVDKYDPSSLSGNSILCFMQDQVGSCWVGTFAGGISIDQPGNDNFNYIREQIDGKDGLNNRVVSRIAEDREHNLWIATEGGGVNYYDRKKGQFKYIHANPHSQHLINQEIVKSIQLDGGGNLWFGTLEGLFWYNRTTGAVRSFPLAEKPDRLLDEQIYGLARDSNILWIGAKSGLFRMDAKGGLLRFRHSSKDSNSIVSNDINTLLKDQQGGLWIGTEFGLAYLPQQKFDSNAHPHFQNRFAGHIGAFNGNGILSLYEDTDGLIWIGTRGSGIMIYDRQQDKLFTFNTKNGLADDIVHGIIQDLQGNYWVSFGQGIARIAVKKKGIALTARDFSPGNGNFTITNYSVNNGLGSNEFLAAACRTSAGEIFFGGVNGIVSFKPEKLFVNNNPPPVVLTELLIKNIPAGIDSPRSPLRRSITYTDTITLTYDQAYFTIRFAALNYINSKTNQYAYMMEGLNGSRLWYDVGNQQSATYTNIEPGDYIFKVKAANNDGLWNESYTSLHIKVLPPFWKTTWAYILYSLLIGGLLYFFYYYSLKTARLSSDLQMQRLSREKDQDLMQRKLSFFTNISHEIKTPLTLILAPIEKLMHLSIGNAKAMDQLLIMQRSGERLLRLTNQLLDFRKLEEGSLPLQVSEGDLIAFVREIIHSFESYSHHRDIELAFNSDHDTLPGWFDPDKLEKMLFNLLSNAFKFTPPGGRITVSVSSTYGSGAKEAVIRVEDNGAGIAEKNLEKIFYPFHHYNDTGLLVDGTGIGLSFTKGLITVHHGSISVQSRQAAGGLDGFTCFTLILPINREGYSAEEIAGTPDDRWWMDKSAPDRQDGHVAVGRVGTEEEDGVGREDGSRGADVDLPVMLLVEDNPEVRAFMKSHFADWFAVHEAGSGKEGWKIVTALIPDIVISDVMMPEMNGIEFCKLIKEDPRTSHIPVILLTARTPLASRMEGFEMGADDYITKPFSLALLQVRVNNLLTSRRLLRERYRKDITLQPSNITITATDETFLTNLIRYIEDNMMEPSLNVEQLGREAAMSRVTLYRKMKALTNMSPIEFIRSIRLKKAAQLLRSRQYTVSEVTYMVGFSDVDYFRKWFKAEFGSNPKEYAAGGDE